MSKDKTLRDEIAMSMTSDTLPTINDEATMALVNEKYKLEWSEDPLVQIEWSIKYQAIVRYMYADAMLAARQ